MDVMNKSVFYYLPVMFLISGYLYFSHWSNNNWNQLLKFKDKSEYVIFGKELTTFNVQEVNVNDFFILKDTNEVRTFFKVIGKTKENELAVQYGKSTEVLPTTLDYENYMPKTSYNLSGFNIEGPPINWVNEIVSLDENFDEKITFYTQEQLNNLLLQNKIGGFIKKQNFETKDPLLTGDFLWDLKMKFILGDPIFLIPIILVLIFLFWISERLKKIYFQEKRSLFYYLLSTVGIGIFAYLFKNELTGPTYNGASEWYNLSYIFISYVFVFFIINFLSQNAQNYTFAKRQFLIFFAIIVTGILVQITIKTFINNIFYNNNIYDKYEESFTTIVFWVLSISFKAWLMIATANFLNNLIGYISSLRRKSKQLQAVTSVAQVSADALLQSEAHVNTHFLYNSLHAIAALAPVAADKTETLALSLAKYYRYTTNRNDEKWITIKEDAEALTSYLEVEKIRLGEKLTYAFDVSDDVSGVKIPKFLLQPLVENAIKYGYDVDKDTTNVKLSFHKLDHTILKISVCDSGKSFGDQMEIGTGIRQVKDLLKRFYPEGHTISFVNEPVKCVEIILNKKNISQ